MLSNFRDNAMRDNFEGILMENKEILRLRDLIMLEGRIQVFLSSPFGGFEHERHYFMQTHYPALQRLCMSRGVELSVVDLRWGITAAQASANRIIDVCLHEVANSHIFVGMLGARYGSSTLVEANKSWIEPSIEHCVGKYPWLREYSDRSITEMEWLYASLLGKEKGCLELPSIFMLRDLRYDAQKVEQKSDEPSEMSKFTVESEKCRGARDTVMEHVRKLAKECKTNLYDNYPNPLNGIDKLNDGLLHMLKTLLPDEDAVKDSKSFALMRKYKNAYVPGGTHSVTIDAVSEFIDDDHSDDVGTRNVRVGVVYSGKGMGKSSVLTNIVDKYSVKEVRCERIIIEKRRYEPPLPPPHRLCPCLLVPGARSTYNAAHHARTNVSHTYRSTRAHAHAHAHIWNHCACLTHAPPTRTV